MERIPESLMAEMDARAETDLTRYFERAYAVQEQHGAVSVAACFGEEDIETLKRAMLLATFARVMGTSIGMAAHDAAQIDGLISALGGMIAALEDPTINWRGDDDGE